MSTTPAVNGTSNNQQTQASSGNSASNPLGQLSQSDFLKLITTELNNQDPTKPVDEGQMLAQMSQIASTSSIQNLQQSFNQFVQGMQSNQTIQAASLVGRNVVVPSSTGALPSNGKLSGAVDLSNAVGSLDVNIYDGSGALVRTLSLGQQSAGEVPFTWDGMDGNGNPMPAGQYTVKAASTTDGASTSQTVLMSGAVSSVQMGSNGGSPTLAVQGIGNVNLSDVQQIL